MSTSSLSRDQRTAGPRSRIPSGPALVAGVYVICVLGLSLVMVAEIIWGAKDPHRSEGPIESLQGILLFGTIGLLIAVVPALFLKRSDKGSKVGAIVYGALAVPALVFVWCGLPGVFGATAAWLGGVTRGRPAQRGAARVFGVLGLCLAILNPIVTIIGVVTAGMTENLY